MNKNVKIAKELIKLAKSIISQDIMINTPEEFINQVENESLYDDLDYIGKWNNMDTFNADTNGNDHLYALHLFIDNNILYYADASLTEDDIKNNGDDAMPEVDDFRGYKYDEFPFSLNKFKSWLNKRIDDGIEEGRKVFNNNDLTNLEVGQYIDNQDGTKTFKLDIPDWSLSYLVNGDNSGLEDGEEEEIKDWEKQNHVISVDPTNEHAEFNRNPEFGLPTSTTVCFVITK